MAWHSLRGGWGVSMARQHRCGRTVSRPNHAPCAQGIMLHGRRNQGWMLLPCSAGHCQCRQAGEAGHWPARPAASLAVPTSLINIAHHPALRSCRPSASPAAHPIATCQRGKPNHPVAPFLAKLLAPVYTCTRPPALTTPPPRQAAALVFPSRLCLCAPAHPAGATQSQHRMHPDAQLLPILLDKMYSAASLPAAPLAHLDEVPEVEGLQAARPPHVTPAQCTQHLLVEPEGRAARVPDGKARAVQGTQQVGDGGGRAVRYMDPRRCWHC